MISLVPNQLRSRWPQLAPRRQAPGREKVIWLGPTRMSRMQDWLKIRQSLTPRGDFKTGVFQGKVKNFPEVGLELFGTLRRSIVFLFLRFGSLKLLRRRTVILV